MNQGRVTLTQRELNRAFILERVVGGRMSVREAALVLKLSERHVKRLKQKWQKEGAAGLAHGNRGRKPAHAISDQVRQQVVQLAQTKYRGCNYTFLSELLGQHEGISLSPSSVRRILRTAGIASPRKHRPPKLHRRRQRKPQMGMLVLIDGSHHDWLEGRGPRLCLHAAIDDATGRILAATFRPTEDFEGYRQMLLQLVTEHGIPLAIYSDRHSLFRSPKETDDATLEQQLLGQYQPLSQIGRILSELGIERIYAQSPQAKGRIERAFLTLQERLRVELRLAGACTLDEANAVLKEYIPRYNERFAVPAAEAEPAFRPIPPHIRLEHIFCRKEQRQVHPGYTIHYGGHAYRLATPKGAPTIPLRSVVDVLEHPDGSIYVAWKGHIYAAELLPEAETLRRQAGTDAARSTPKEKAGSTSTRRPAANHPWRKRAVTPRPNSITGTASLNRGSAAKAAASGP
jgi:transposase